MKVNCELSEYEVYIQGMGDSELLGILAHISKNSVPDRYAAVVQESKQRGLIGKDGNEKQPQGLRHDRPARKMTPGGNIKGTIIIAIFICLLSAIPFGIGIRHGLKYGLLAGLIAFLIHGGIEWLWVAVTWPKEERHPER